jgi:hypothetical protein
MNMILSLFLMTQIVSFATNWNAAAPPTALGSPVSGKIQTARPQALRSSLL